MHMAHKRMVALLVTMALALAGFAPALAAGHAATSPMTALGAVLPAGEELTDDELAAIRGAWVHWALGAVVGAATYVVANWGEEIDAEYAAGLLAATAMGALSGGIGAGLMSVTTTTAGQLAAGTFAASMSLVTEAALSHH